MRFEISQQDVKSNNEWLLVLEGSGKERERVQSSLVTVS